MAASVNDKFSKVSTGARPNTTTVASIRAVAGASLVCDDLTGWDTDTGVHFVTYRVDGQGDIVAGSQIDMKGTVSSNTISNIVITGGTDTGNAVGDIVQQIPTAAWAKDLADGLLVSHDQDGTLKAGAVDNAAALASDVVTTAKIADANVTTAKLADAAVTPTKRTGGFKVGTFTVTATGSQSITGVGFRPKSIIFMPMLTDSTSQGLFGLGFWDGTSSVSMNMGARITATSGNFTQEATGTVFRASDFSSGAENVKAQATGTSLDSDGFTVNVVAASGTQVIAYIAFG